MSDLRLPLLQLPRSLVLAILAVLPTHGFTDVAAVDAQTNPVSWRLEAGKAGTGTKAGAATEVRLTATIEEGWHLYAMTQPPGGPKATRITVSGQQPFVLARPVQAPDPIMSFDRNFNIVTEYYAKSVTFRLPIKVRSTAESGEQPLEVHAYYQACTDDFCLPPRTEKLILTLSVTAGKQRSNSGF